MTSQRLAVPGSVLLLLCVGLLSAADDPPAKSEAALIGRWDLTVQSPDGAYPSWLEIRRSGRRTLVGSYVGRFGSARPIAKIELVEGHMSFTVPPQWEQRKDDVRFAGRLEGETLSGETTDDEGRKVNWTGRRAPSLKRTAAPSWGEPIELFSGKDLAGWKPRNPGSKSGWTVRDGVLVNAVAGNDLLTERKFTDFQLHAEFRYPKGSNSGVYLRGRYEVQIEDNHGLEPDSHYIGGVYGFLTPSINAAKSAGEWQSLDVTLVGRRGDHRAEWRAHHRSADHPGNYRRRAGQRRGRSRADPPSGRSWADRVPQGNAQAGCGTSNSSRSRVPSHSHSAGTVRLCMP